MIQSSYEWELMSHVSDESFIKCAQKEGLDTAAAHLLYNRGIQTEEALQAFLRPSLDQLHDPYLLHGMDKAVERIRRGIAAGESILIYGDYDADGMTSASILKEALEELGAEVRVYLPNRFTDGYGPNLSVYKYFIEQEGMSLILTVDNGVAGHEALAYAKEAGVDVVVTDHHSLPDSLPDAYAILHPEHPEGSYPFPHLAGCGVAFKLACALHESIQPGWLDLVAIGTIADMVSLTGENRILVKQGLSILKQTERLGLEELIRIAGLDQDSLDEESVGFQLAPRLNALGRLDDPNPALDLLTTFDEEEAHELARTIDDYNTQRKEIVETIYQEAKALVDPSKPVQVLSKEGWNPGVLGIVAGRLMEERQEPILVLSIEEGRAKGSARSTAAVDLFEALSGHPDLFLAFGGHAGAAGMTLEVDKLSQLSAVLTAYILDKGVEQAVKPSLLLDEELDLEELSLATLKSFDKLSPYGMDHKKPVFYIKDVQVESARTMGQQNAHLKFRISKGKAAYDVVAFGMGRLVLEFSQAKQLELAVTLSVNKWNGQTTLQLMLVDARVKGVQLYNIRGKQHNLPTGIPVLEWEEGRGERPSHPAVVLDRLPQQLTCLRPYFKDHSFEAVYFKNTLPTTDYLEGYGTREQFAKLYKTLYQFKEFDVRYKLKDLSSYLKIKQPLLIQMLRIFEELGFATIEDGVMKVVPNAAKRPITDSQIYQQLKEEVTLQELFALGTVQEIYDWLCQEV